MELWQKIVVILFLIFSVGGTYDAFNKVVKNKVKFERVGPFIILGAFFTIDQFIFAPFWMLFSIVSIFLKDWYLFLLGISLFWVVRSIGEMVYWLNQQFSKVERNPEGSNFISKTIFKSDVHASWIAMQIWWQLFAVISLLASIYFGKLWLE